MPFRSASQSAISRTTSMVRAIGITGDIMFGCRDIGPGATATKSGFTAIIGCANRAFLSLICGIAVMDATTTDNQSGLLVDNIVVTPVPEPTTVAFSIAGASLLMALRRRIKKTA